ncbi:MAG TPA: nucleotide-binding protein [Fimbriimonadaceae bacterium]|jgi:predicted nucleotide-binding protein
MALYPSIKPFIVHGHDHAFRDQITHHLRNTLGMAEPLILDGVASAGRTVIEKFEEESAKCNIAVVLLTPDDEAKTTTGVSYNTARANVWLELGYFIATFGRKSGRTLLIYKKGLDIPTDLAGLVYIDATSGITDQNVSKRLETELNYIVNSGIGASPIGGPGLQGSYAVTGRLNLTP